MKEQNEFKPYISSDVKPSELTLTSIIVGVLLAIVFGAANAYLGLRVGMTVSASIPAAVISMGVIRILLRRNSILESNMVQTIGSAGESLAAGAIFTLPALFLWAKEGLTEKPSLLEISLISLIGGLLGVFFMIPLRNALIVKEHNTLPYPEGTACAEVLLAGEKGGTNCATVFWGMGFSAIFKFLVDGFKLFSGELALKLSAIKSEIGTQTYPAVMSVGYICGPRISSYMFAGGIFSWLVLIPTILLFGENIVLYPESTKTIGQLYSLGGASAIWSTYIRYIGAGALACGGIINLIKSFPLILKTFSGAIKGASTTKNLREDRTTKNISMRATIISIIILIIIMAVIDIIPVSFLGSIIIVIFGFFFATVSSRMVGLVGSSNNPISGMSIATLLIATFILKLTGTSGIGGMASAISIGSVICIITALAGDTSQDLKTGYLLGATPKKQQIGEIIGVLAASLAIGATMYLLDQAWGFQSEELSAPQATLMKMIVEGVMGGNLPWILVIIGIVIAIVIEIVGVPVLPFAIGVYLPVHLNACIMIGGLIRLYLDKKKLKENEKKKVINRGLLFSSGLIAGEGVIGIILAVLAILGLDKAIDFSSIMPENLSLAGGILLFALSIFMVAYVSTKNELS